MQSNPLAGLIAERYANSPPPALKEPIHFGRFAVAVVPMYALVMLITHHYGAAWLDAFTLANSATAIYFVLLSRYYERVKKTNQKRMREWRRANGWLVSD